MGSINDQVVTDNVTDVLAAQYNALLGSIAKADWSNATTMSGTVTLVDSDYLIQRFNCNGANRIVKLPAYSTSNHPFFIINVTATTYTLDVQSNAGVTLLTAPLAANGGIALVYPDGTAGFYNVSGGGGGTWGSITGTLASQTDLLYAIQPQQGVMRNGKLSVTVTSNNLTVALKTLAGNDPSASEPVRVYLGGGWRSVTAALSVTKNAGTNWFNSGGAELATNEIDYFAYLGYNATDGVVIGFARIPFAKIYSEFNTTNTNEQYAAISTITNAAAGDEYAVIGRFAATLSAGAGYTWSVPTFTASNLIQHPMEETRWLNWSPQYTGFSANPSSDMNRYRVKSHEVSFVHRELTSGTSNATTFTISLPFAAKTLTNAIWGGTAQIQDSGTVATTPGVLRILSAATVMDVFKDYAGGAFTNSGNKRLNQMASPMMYEI